MSKVGPHHLIRSIAVDDEGVFYIAIDRRLGVLTAAITFALAVVVTVVSVLALANSARISGQQQQLRDGAFGECRRIQILRDDLNNFEGTVYVFVDAAYKARAAAYASTGDPSDRKAAHAYRILLRAVQYIPPTNCNAAVDHPLSYTPPAPIPYPDAIKAGSVHPPTIAP